MTTASSLRIKQVNGAIDELGEAEFVAETPISLAVTFTDQENNPNFVYSLTSEDNLHQTAEADYTGILDGTAGITYNGPAGATNYVRVSCVELELVEGIIAPANADKFVPALYVNSNLHSYFDTEDSRAPNGGFIEEFGTGETAAEYHLDTYVPVENGDVLRIAVLQSTESTVDVDINDAGNFFIS